MKMTKRQLVDYVTEQEIEIRHHMRILLAKLKRRMNNVNELMEQVVEMDLTPADIDNIAIVCHEANRAYCRTIGDYNHEPWADTPLDLKNSVRSGVITHLENPDLTPESSHQNWLDFKAKDGWTYGPVKDFKLKQHPCFVAYGDLPTDDRLKDHLFKAIVNSLDPRKHRK